MTYFRHGIGAEQCPYSAIEQAYLWKVISSQAFLCGEFSLLEVNHLVICRKGPLVVKKLGLNFHRK